MDMSMEVKLNPGSSTDQNKDSIKQFFQEVKTSSPLDEVLSLHKCRRKLGKEDDLTLLLEGDQSNTEDEWEKAIQKIPAFIKEHIKEKLQASNLVLEGWSLNVSRPDSGFSEDTESWEDPCRCGTLPEKLPEVKTTKNDVLGCRRKDSISDEHNTEPAKEVSETNMTAVETFTEQETADNHHDSFFGETEAGLCPVSHEMPGFTVTVPDGAIFGSSRTKELELIQSPQFKDMFAQIQRLGRDLPIELENHQPGDELPVAGIRVLQQHVNAFRAAYDREPDQDDELNQDNPVNETTQQDASPDEASGGVQHQSTSENVLDNAYRSESDSN